jgi:hypothetical protein
VNGTRTAEGTREELTMKRLRTDGVNKEQQERPIADPEEFGRSGNPQNAETYDVGMTADSHAHIRALGTDELEPRGDDILPDQIQRMEGAPDEDDVEVTARPREQVRPISSDELPEG